MKNILNIGLLVALCLLGLIGLFPPVTTGPYNSEAGLWNRNFLLTFDGLTYSWDPGGRQWIGQPGAHINSGRLVAEALVIGSAAGLLVLLRETKSKGQA